MEGMIGEVRLFAGTFAPKSWAFCNGQIINISSNTALYSILGTQYGGNGTTTFGLPDFRGRVVIGTGNGPGLSPYNNGLTGGADMVTLTIAQMPIHTHMAAMTLNANGNGGNTNTASGNFPAAPYSEGGSGDPGDVTAFASPGPNPVTMNSTAVSYTGTSQTGSSMAHTNQQPYTCLYYIICQYGVFPSRN